MSALAPHDVAAIRAENASPFTLTGTNTYVVGRGGAWVIDPGPALPAHVEAVAAEVRGRGGLAGIALTHDHPDHAEAVPALRERFRAAGTVVPVAAMRGAVELPLEDGARAGPFEALATPGHAPDHLTYLLAGDDATIAFTGDAVLGAGSVFVAPDPGALAGYLAGLERLRTRAPRLICPGHGPLVEDPAAKIDEYVAHRLERERALLDALAAGARTIDELLDQAWADAPPMLRPAATITLAAHLDKLADEGRLPPGVERPARPPWLP
ncbi:MAG TPA: MBL fold metallo-hydrolase [Conexibacter sp.]|nr:MBL fold metallo-hydrolase [Conexibacter sp.]